MSEIHRDLSSGETDVTKARRLKGNLGISFQGTIKAGAFDIPESLAKQLLAQPNPDSSINADVVQPWINGSDVTGRPRSMWIINFAEMRMAEASLYEAPFEYVNKNIRSKRQRNRDLRFRTYWWRLGRSRVQFRESVQSLDRYIATPSSLSEE